MKRGKRGSGIHIHLSNRLAYTLIAIFILIAIGVGIYAASYSASGAGHPYTEISTCAADQILKMNSAGNAWTCITLPSQASWPYVQDIKLTTVTHKGNFSGYNGIYNWIQVNGCSGYHVCSANEIVNALQNGMNPLSNNVGGWYTTGVQATYPTGTDSSVLVNDCTGWTYEGSSGMGAVFYHTNFIYQGTLYNYTDSITTYCSNSYAVLCCK